MNRGNERLVRLAWVFVLAVSVGVSATAKALGPYVADANTLHLYHFDEAEGSGSAVDTGLADTLRDLEVGSTAVQGAPSYAGFGSSLDTTAMHDNSIAVSDVMAQSEMQGADGAFTYEAIVQVSDLLDYPETEILIGRQLPDNIAFQWRLNGRDQGSIDLNAVYVMWSDRELVTAAIPRDGPHAWVPGEWFHVAVAYTGVENTEGNVQMYWTRLSDSVTQANPIETTGMLTRDLIDVDGPMPTSIANRIGQDDESLPGTIDEVRISSIARGAGDFLFNGDGPSCAPGDANGDGEVDDDDLSLLLANWGGTVDCTLGEFSGAPPVDDDDLSLLLANWTGAGPVPEPITLTMLAVGAAALIRRRSRSHG